MIAPGATARPRGQGDASLADPRKAAVRLPEIGSFEALELPENARCAGREPPLFSLSGGRGAPSWSTPTMPAHGVGTPAWASACLQPAEGGRGPFFVAPRARPRVPGAVSEWVSFGKPSSPAIRNRTPNKKPSTRARSVLFGKWVAGAARAQQTSPWTARSSSSSVGCV